MATVFFSYSHKDEELRDRLEVALSAMKRQGLIDAWHDRRLSVGDDFDKGVRSELERADVILLLVSPDFIASDYCHDVEMVRALERHKRGEARVIPVILRACDWKQTAFKKLLAAPTDGKPIRSWPDLDEAFLDVVQKIRQTLSVPVASTSKPDVLKAGADTAPSNAGLRSSNLRLRKNFTDVDRDRFLDEAFDYIGRFFEGSLAELEKRNGGIETNFRRVDANRFTAVIYEDGNAVARCAVFMDGSMGRGISYSSTDSMIGNGFNENLRVEADEQGMFLKSMGMAMTGSGREQKLTYEGGAELYWDMLIGPLRTR
ncbi:toll/interleukin-1 receptor domain-containing protein [Chenggangzhangella methanolivorans]|uniref:Toll/interleukin-1 receptor domain-containing protein n=2 Tax=Chenggangzhangella methanolivorans TaxID=1437009 RepID=A0A9E6UQ19_9HYPH|nr:toll/interleukin-1 receptor domain-containing protein [Chenggangzhangella methanolivorans]